mmetsp:Transcript_146690/g.470730  ORF Transcript_146690/g.470730 Transcript_146690/m.470730 type:complete len:270 (-) Transcript_146690:759-1568(-)
MGGPRSGGPCSASSLAVGISKSSMSMGGAARRPVLAALGCRAAPRFCLSLAFGGTAADGCNLGFGCRFRNRPAQHGAKSSPLSSASGSEASSALASRVHRATRATAGGLCRGICRAAGGADPANAAHGLFSSAAPGLSGAAATLLWQGICCAAGAASPAKAAHALFISSNFLAGTGPSRRPCAISRMWMPHTSQPAFRLLMHWPPRPWFQVRAMQQLGSTSSGLGPGVNCTINSSSSHSACGVQKELHAATTDLCGAAWGMYPFSGIRD